MAANGLRRVLDDVRTVQGLAAERAEVIAWGLLTEFFDVDSEAVSRRNAIVEVTQRLGLGGPSRRAAGRRIAEAWQLLELGGLVCRDPDQSQGDWWFLTQAGADALARDDMNAVPQASRPG